MSQPINPSQSVPQRPALIPGISAEEFSRWYWLKDELVSFARELGIRTSGGKEELTARIRSTLAGALEPAMPVTTKRHKAAPQLSGELTPDTRIPPGQRCSQILRGWFRSQIGEAFHFDAAMREFFATADGTTTLQDAITHYWATRSNEPREIDAQFEYNRFTRAWRKEHPDAPRSELLAAWQQYRATPIDQRGRI